MNLCSGIGNPEQVPNLLLCPIWKRSLLTEVEMIFKAIYGSTSAMGWFCLGGRDRGGGALLTVAMVVITGEGQTAKFC